jgi:hypothetical protein
MKTYKKKKKIAYETPHAYLVGNIIEVMGICLLVARSVMSLGQITVIEMREWY